MLPIIRSRNSLLACLPMMFACVLCAPATAAAATTTLVAGHARFEFLTPSLVRMEYSPSGSFVDAPTAVVQKRDWPAVPMRSTQKDGWIIASTGGMTLRYRLHSGPFAAGNLQLSWRDRSGTTRQWHPGDVDRRNLGGLTYSLDNISKPNLPTDGEDLASPVNDVIPGIDVLLAPAKPGLLSRSGYAFIDDSRTPVWNARTAWIEPREQAGGQDWYVFTYHRDYRRVLREYAQLCGPVPMVPRYVLGPWITDFNFEYFPGTAAASQPDFMRYNEQHLKDEVTRFRQAHIPLDSLVLDFGWHNYGWQGGYDWSPLIAHPGQLLDWLHAQGIKVSLNDHPGYANTNESILSYQDSRAPQVLKALGQPLPPKLSFDLPIATPWQFATDPHDQGVRQRWFAPGSAAATWQPIRLGASWQEQGFGTYQGVAWYRTSLRLPPHPAGPLYLYLGQVSASYALYVNGHAVAHSQVQWPRRLTYADISPWLKDAAPNEIALRVEGGNDASGILRGPVAIRDAIPPPRIYFDLSNQQQAAVFMDALHKPLMQQGVDSWWVDGGSGAVDMPGLNKQLWTNKVFYDYTEQESGKRGFILSRYGDWGSERYPAFFTGDTYSEWPVLSYEVAYTARGGNVLVPYISHDIGGFHGGRIDFDLYARWVEFGAFSPILRLHSAHENPREGNLRMPWTYGDRGMALVRKYFTLRTELIPYIYTYAWLAHTESMPILRPLYLEYPKLEEAYRHPHEYFFGSQMLVAPVLDASGNRSVYLPPGEWIDYFSGRRYHGGRSFTAHYAVDQIPVFVRAGSIIPSQPADMAWSDARPPDQLVLDVYGSGVGRFDLYEDDGTSMAYAQGRRALTPMTLTAAAGGMHRLAIGPATGTFAGQVQRRSWELRIHAASRPQSMAVNGRDVSQWSWDAGHSIATVALPMQGIREPIRVSWQAAAP